MATFMIADTEIQPINSTNMYTFVWDIIKFEPYFEIYSLMTLKNESKLLSYESYFHQACFDTMNNTR